MGQLKIAICTKLDIHGVLVVKRLLPLLTGHETRVFCSIKTRPDEERDPDLKMFKLLERDIAIDALSPLAASADGYASTGWTPLPNLFANDGGALLAEYEPDVIISIRFSLIFKPWLIERIKYGIINIHPGPLPGYRGLFTPFWQLMNQERTLGCTVHWVDQGIDTGPVLGYGSLARDPRRSLLWHIPQIYISGLPLVADAVHALRAGERPAGEAQTGAVGQYYKFPTSDDFARFRREAGELATVGDYADLLGLAYGSASKW